MAAVILLSTLSASGAAYAATGQYFTFTKFSTDQNSPTTVNTSTVDVEGSFNGVSADSMYYEVVSIVDSKEIPGSSGADVKPLISNEKFFKFPNVKLAQGLNKVTVYGTKSDGSLASSEAFVNFSNVPAIYNIQLVDGTPLSESIPTLVNTAGLTLTLEAPNASEVMINSTRMYSGGSATFVIADFPLVAGLNKLTFVATTDGGTRTYSISREVVYAPVGSGTPHNTKIGSTIVDNSGVTSNTTTGELKGKLSGSITFKTSDDSSTPKLTTFTYQVKKTLDGSVVDGGDGTATIISTSVSSNNDYITFNYAADSAAPISLTDNGVYTISFYSTVTGNVLSYDGKSITPVTFTFHNDQTAYITDVEQVYSPSVIDTTNKIVSYSSSGEFSGNTSLFELPLWLVVKTSDAAAASRLSITTLQNGTANIAQFSKEEFKTIDGYKVYKITGLPNGEQVLKVTLSSPDSPPKEIDSRTYTLNYISAPYIELTNLYNNKMFTNAEDFTSITGRLVNFTSVEKPSVSISINGTTVAPVYDTASPFNFTYTIQANSPKLVTGPNRIVVTGKANGVPVSTNVTVYLFPDDLPVLRNVVPLPIGELSDPNHLFVETDALQFTTNQTEADIKFYAAKAKEIVIVVDGVQSVTAKWNGSAWTTEAGSGVGSKVLIPPTNSTMDPSGEFTLQKQELPKTGLRTIVITARLDTSTVTQSLLITREIPPYSILSPKLPNESVIKQNFVNVSILAEGASGILIGKTPMVKDPKVDIFRLEVKGLKKGKNTIKFTITSGTTKTNGSFDITYSDEVLQGAQLKTTLTSAGKLTAFQNSVVLNFPKGTMLRDATPTPGSTNTRQINLFNDQYILLGIADKQDGRTIKQYNQVGEWDNAKGVYLDGDIKEIDAKNLATTYLTTGMLHYGYASNLYWIDAGYFVQGKPINDYSTISASDPYKTNNEFFSGHVGKWMEPTQQGTITLKYDPNIVNAVNTSLSVWKNVDSTWYNMGGIVNTGSKTITATFDGFGYYTVVALRYSYDDIVSHPYARNELETMLAKGIMKTKDANEFGVYENMTRGEFATMLVKIMGISLDYDPNNLTFSDVVKYSDYHWDYRYIETAVRKGLVKGTAPRVFSPNRALSREDAAVMIARAMNLKLGTIEKDLTTLQKLFTDTGSIVSSYSVPSILAVYKAGIISGIENKLVAGQKKITYRFDPQAKFTRADAAVMAQRMMIKMKKL